MEMTRFQGQAFVMKKGLFADFVETLKREGVVVAPKPVGKDILYMPVEHASEVDFSRIPLDDPKMYVFPMTEKILKFEDGKIKPILKSMKRVLLGVRPCDVAALQCLKRFFGNDIETEIRDPYIMDRMDRLMIVAFNCTNPKEHCFCSAMGTGPVATSGFDVSLTDIGGEYLVESGSEDGKRIVQNLALPPASFEKMGMREKIGKRCETEMDIDFNAEGIEKKIEKTVNAVAEKYAKKCIVCGGCNFYCPTCSCYNMSDIQRGPVVERVRFWDSCMLRGFTWLAGGTFERDALGTRMKQRLMHKLSYTVEHYGLLSCTGCGRCSQVCPSYIFMEDMIRDILRGG